MSAFFEEVYGRYGSWTHDSPPLGMTKSDWNALLTISTVRHDELAAYQGRLAAELCSRSTTINTQTQLAVALEENARSTRDFAHAYGDELGRKLSPEGREIVNGEVDELWDAILTVDLDYTTYLVAASVEPAAYFDSACSPPWVDENSATSAGGASRRSKPDALPLAVFVGDECTVSAEFVRQSAEMAISGEEIEPLRWPTLQKAEPWFGVYAGLECADGKSSLLRVSLIDSIDGSLILYQSLFDGGDAMGLGRPPAHGPMSYPSFVSTIVDGVVSRFLRARFELP
jgi:hypothetical protein